MAGGCTLGGGARRAVNELQLTDEFVHPPDRVLRCPGRCVLRRGGVTALDRARDEGELEPMAMDELCRRARRGAKADSWWRPRATATVEGAAGEQHLTAEAAGVGESARHN